MDARTSSTALLLDARQRQLGQVFVEHAATDLIVGTFRPGPQYPAVERLFQRFEEAANAQALAAVDQLDAAIAALGLSLAWPGEAAPRPVRDVQIWSDGGFSCRPVTGAEAEANGSPVAARPTQPAGE